MTTLDDLLRHGKDMNEREKQTAYSQLAGFSATALRTFYKNAAQIGLFEIMEEVETASGKRNNIPASYKLIGLTRLVKDKEFDTYTDYSQKFGLRISKTDSATIVYNFASSDYEAMSKAASVLGTSPEDFSASRVDNMYGKALASQTFEGYDAVFAITQRGPSQKVVNETARKMLYRTDFSGVLALMDKTGVTPNLRSGDLRRANTYLQSQVNSFNELQSRLS